jgi:hypothetical protein
MNALAFLNDYGVNQDFPQDEWLANSKGWLCGYQLPRDYKYNRKTDWKVIPARN